MKKIIIMAIFLLINPFEASAQKKARNNFSPKGGVIIKESIQRGWKDAEFTSEDRQRVSLIKEIDDEFYKRNIEYKGITIKGSHEITDLALVKSYGTIEKLLGKRPDILGRMAKKKTQIMIIGQKENFCSFPETQNQVENKTFDNRTVCDLCGGAFSSLGYALVCEVNILKLKNDPFGGKTDVLIHEFAHLIYGTGITSREKSKIEKVYKNLLSKNMFVQDKEGNTSYMMQNDLEFFAVLTGIWFDAHRVNDLNHPANMNDKEAIKKSIPEMYTILKSIYGE